MQDKDHELREKLTAEQYHITQEKGTERPFSGLYVDNKQAGIYHCIVCDTELFNAEHKYDSGSGWPSFYQSLDTLRIEVDNSNGMHREEVLCKNCGAHLGHIFPDGPEPTGMRYCINSSALNFENQPDSEEILDVSPSRHEFEYGCSERLVGTHYVLGNQLTPPYPAKYKLAVFGLGCFWGAEKCFWNLNGVYSTAVGYAGGSSENPTYKQVCHANSGHIEVVLVVYDERILPYQQLLNNFWESHNPTQGMRQGNDIGDQYQSVIYVYDEAQANTAKSSLTHYQLRLNESGHQNPITTQINPAPRFYFAEDYHQQYLAKNVNGYCGLGGLGVSC